MHGLHSAPSKAVTFGLLLQLPAWPCRQAIVYFPSVSAHLQGLTPHDLLQSAPFKSGVPISPFAQEVSAHQRAPQAQRCPLPEGQALCFAMLLSAPTNSALGICVACLLAASDPCWRFTSGLHGVLHLLSLPIARFECGRPQ